MEKIKAHNKEQLNSWNDYSNEMKAKVSILISYTEDGRFVHRSVLSGEETIKSLENIVKMLKAGAINPGKR